MPNNQTQIWMGSIITPKEIIKRGLLVVKGKKIVFAGQEVDWNQPLDGVIHKVSNGWIAPGFIDLHIHGIAGNDTMDGTFESLNSISLHLAQYGVTGFLATTMTAPIEDLVKVAENIARFANEQERGMIEGAKVLGIHLEGPWINPEYKGAQNGEGIVSPATEELDQITRASDGWLRLVTLAPELPESIHAISYLQNMGIKVSAGHTGAKFDQVSKAVEQGVVHFTHCFNAMRGLHHREPGVAGAAMYFEHAWAELIADGIHVHPAVMKILYKMKTSERLLLVSDAMRAAGMGNGCFELGGQQVYVADQQAKLMDGTLAGSVLTLNKAIKNMVEMCGVSVHEAVQMASLTPAEAIGLDHRKGKLQEGYDADLVILTDEFEVLITIIEGQSVHAV